MPIYEFRCLKCGEVFEILSSGNDTDAVLACPKCKSEDIERVLSRTNYIKGLKGKPQPKLTTRSCAGSGTCATIDIPGPSK